MHYDYLYSSVHTSTVVRTPSKLFLHIESNKKTKYIYQALFSQLDEKNELGCINRASTVCSHCDSYTY